MLATAYACAAPSLDGAFSEATGCAEHAVAAGDAAQPLRCKAHCEAGQTSVNSGAVVASVPPPALLDARWLRAGELDVASRDVHAPAAVQWTGPPSGAPPLYLSLLVLRN